jgi:hypothetical protein
MAPGTHMRGRNHFDREAPRAAALGSGKDSLACSRSSARRIRSRTWVGVLSAPRCSWRVCLSARSSCKRSRQSAHPATCSSAAPSSSSLNSPSACAERNCSMYVPQSTRLASDRFPSNSQRRDAELPQSGIVSELSLRSIGVKTGLFPYLWHKTAGPGALAYVRAIPAT